jgi:hypothetical protein
MLLFHLDSPPLELGAQSCAPADDWAIPMEVTTLSTLFDLTEIARIDEIVFFTNHSIPINLSQLFRERQNELAISEAIPFHDANLVFPGSVG